MKRAIRVYLDSSDFSDFSNLSNKGPEYRDVLLYLISKRDSGLIELYFSEAHIVEAAPTMRSAIPAALTRLATIKNLCSRNSLIHPVDLIAREVAGDGRSATIDFDMVRGNGGWLPAVFDLSDALPDVEELVRQDVEKLGRSDRRKYLKNGKPTAVWYAEMRQANAGNPPALLDNLPLTPVAVRTVQRYFTGEVSRSDALKALYESVTDLEVFGQWYLKDWESASSTSSYLRQIGVEFEGALKSARDRFNALTEKHVEAGIDRKELLDLSVAAFHEVLTGSSQRLSRKFAAQIGSVPKLMNGSLHESPGMTCSMTLAMFVARQSVTNLRQRNPKRSDFPDCYHAVYLPYVDIFRADGFMAGMIRECKLPFSTLVVDKLLQLPSKIDELLDAKKF